MYLFTFFLAIFDVEWVLSPQDNFSMSLEYMQSFVRIGGVVFEKTRREKRTDYQIYY